MTSKQLLIATILTFITISAWVGLEALHTRAQVEIPSEVQKIIEPINPGFDTSKLESQ